MKKSGAEILIKLLEDQGITTIAGIPGGANLPIYHPIGKSNIRHVLCRHEQAAGFIAQGMARTTGQPAVCMATSGPGATNLMTAIADARLDSIPIIAITGQVPIGMIGSDAFQEVDTYGMSIPITKHNFLVRSAKDLFWIIPEAFNIASEGRPGPVLIDMPKDVQKEMVALESWPEPRKTLENDTVQVDLKKIDQISEAIYQADRPIIYAGGGVVQAGVCDDIRLMAEKQSIPVTQTLMGLGCIPSDHNLSLGMLGMHGSTTTNGLLRETDLLIALGVRFDDRATGKVAEFCPQAKIIHIDIDHSELNKIKNPHISLQSDLRHVIKELVPRIKSKDRSAWRSRIQMLKEKETVQHHEIYPEYLIRETAKLTKNDTIITTDVGQHQMWVAQFYPFSKPRTLLTSGGLGTMGFGLPAAIGAALANPDETVICFSGDGSLMMNIQELGTLADLQLNVKILLFNNGELGLVRQQQQLFYEKKYVASQFETKADFVAISTGFGIRSRRIESADRAMDIIREELGKPGPVLIDIPIDPTLNVFPMVPPGAANHEMIGGEDL